MTPLRPLPEDRSAKGVSSERYPLNKVCAHPECKEPVVDPHHTFARSQIGNDSWFVDIQLGQEEGQTLATHGLDPVPHVTGLCRAHHDDAEEHRAWIRLEEGVFVWYDRYHKTAKVDEGLRIEKGAGDEGCPPERECNIWEKLGPLNPQPGSVEGKPKRSRFKGEKRRNRKVLAVRVPNDAEENGAELFDDAIQRVEELVNGGDPRPTYFTLMDALEIAAQELANPTREG